MVRSGEIEAGAMLLSMGGGSQETVTEWLDERAKEVRFLTRNVSPAQQESHCRFRTCPLLAEDFVCVAFHV